MRHRLLALMVLAAGPAPALEAPQAPPGYSASVQGTGIPGIENGRLMLWNAPKGWDPATTLRVDRHVAAGSGEAGHTYKALWVNCSAAGESAGYEWCGTAELANSTPGETGAQNVALNATAFKRRRADGRQVGPTWAGNSNCVDDQGIADPRHSCVGHEIDVAATSATSDALNQRVGLQISGGGVPGAEVGYGLLMGQTAGSTIKTALGLRGDGVYGTGLDASAARFTKAAIVLGANQAVVVDGDPATGAFGHWIAWNGQFLGFYTHGAAPLQVHDDRVVVPRLVEEAPRVPASSSAPCQAGERAWDQDYEYRCVARDRWKRAALGDW